MIEATGKAGQADSTAALSAAQKARVIYEEARSTMAGKLWRAALGSVDDKDAASPIQAATGQTVDGRDTLGLDRLMAMLDDQAKALFASATAAADVAASSPVEASAATAVEDSGTGTSATLVMADSPNARYAGMLDAAAERTGIPASALAAIVDAEAAKGAGGVWQAYSRNPRSSAAGLGQFLNRTWEGEAERAGTWLNAKARASGWLDATGQVRAESRAAVLATRYDPRTSIEAVADYASANLKSLRKSGVKIGDDVSEVAQAAYLGHHLGLGDARRFLAGGLQPERARQLLGAQVGSTNAQRRIAQAGGAVAAHRTWLLAYVGQHVRPDRFA